MQLKSLKIIGNGLPSETHVFVDGEEKPFYFANIRIQPGEYNQLEVGFNFTRETDFEVDLEKCEIIIGELRVMPEVARRLYEQLREVFEGE